MQNEKKYMIFWHENGVRKSFVTASNKEANDVANRLKHKEKIKVSNVFKVSDNTLPTSFYVGEVMESLGLL